MPTTTTTTSNTNTPASDPCQVKVQGRLSYPSLFEKRSFSSGEGKPAYSASFLFHKKLDAASIAKVQAVIDHLTKTEFGGKSIPPDRICLKDGSLRPDTDGYGPEVMSIGARNETVKPFVVDRDGRTQLSPEDGRPYAGCTVNVVLRLWAQGGKSFPSKFGKRINCSLGNVQFVKDGEPFGQKARTPDQDFESVEDDDPVS